MYLCIVDKCEINVNVCGGTKIVYNASDQNYPICPFFLSIIFIYLSLYLSISIYLGIVDKCDINGTVCGGSPIVYNTSDQNYPICPFFLSIYIYIYLSLSISI